jgi:ribosomal protein S18 acetylase RimI-like enzyme
MDTCFCELEISSYSEEEMNLLSELYPRGQIVCLVDEYVVGILTSRIVPFEKYKKPHTQGDCANITHFKLDSEFGDSLYGLDVCVDPYFQNLRLGQQLSNLMIKNAFEDNFKYVMGNSRVVNYAKYMHEMDLETYAEKVKNKELFDGALSFHLKCGFEFVAENPHFSDDDLLSGGYGVIMAIQNEVYDSTQSYSVIHELDTMPKNQQIEMNYAL